MVLVHASSQLLGINEDTPHRDGTQIASPLLQASSIRRPEETLLTEKFKEKELLSLCLAQTDTGVQEDLSILTTLGLLNHKSSRKSASHPGTKLGTMSEAMSLSYFATLH